MRTIGPSGVADAMRTIGPTSLFSSMRATGPNGVADAMRTIGPTSLFSSMRATGPTSLGDAMRHSGLRSLADAMRASSPTSIAEAMHASRLTRTSLAEAIGYSGQADDQSAAPQRLWVPPIAERRISLLVLGTLDLFLREAQILPASEVLRLIALVLALATVLSESAEYIAQRSR
jgi:hypothetical protein